MNPNHLVLSGVCGLLSAAVAGVMAIRARQTDAAGTLAAGAFVLGFFACLVALTVGSS